MRNAKLWSVLLAAVLLCACVVGVLFVGASAGAETYVYSVGAIDGIEADDPSAISIKDALNKAAEATWASDAKVEIVFASADTSADVTSPGEGESANLLFGQTTIWRGEGETKSKLPITIKGSGDAAAITAPKKTVACANDYTFENLTYTISDSSCKLYAGSGNVAFTRVSFPSVQGYFYADNFTQDAFAGWEALEEGEYVETSITLGVGTSYAATVKGSVCAVGYNPDGSADFDKTNRDILNSDGSLNEANVEKARTDAAALTFAAPTIDGVACADIRPVDTKVTFAIENQLNEEISAPKVYARYGLSPVASATIKAEKSWIGGLCVDSQPNAARVYVGDTRITVDGCQQTHQSVYYRGLTKSYHIGDLTMEIHDSDPNDKFSTYVPTLQGANSADALVIGNYKFYMTGGTLGNGTNANDGYWGAGNVTGTIINHVTGGSIWQFGGARYNITFSNTPVTLPDDTSKNVSVRNIIEGGTFGGTDASTDAILELGGFYGASHSKGGSSSVSVSVPVVCNEISGGTFYNFTGAGNVARAGAGGEIINVITETGDSVPVFQSHFYGGSVSKTVDSVTNYIYGGSFTRNYYGGSACSAEITGDIVNIFKGGKFNATTNRQIYLGNVSGTFTGTVTSEFYDGFDAGKSYVHGGGNATMKAPEGEEYVITNTINGGKFRGFWGVGGGANAVVDGNVKNIINGGTFDSYDGTGSYPSFAGGSRNANLTGNVETTINGGTFSSDVASGVISGGYDKNSDKYLGYVINGDVTTTINGGTFKDDIFADCRNFYSENIDLTTNGTVTLTITETTGKALAIYGEVADCTTFTGNSGTVEIGKNTNIVAADATGTVTFRQTEGWLAHDYFKAPANSIKVSVISENVFGAYDDSEETLALVLVTGKGIDASGVTLILDERLGVRFLFDKALVDQYGDEFIYEFTMEKTDGTYTFEGGYDDLELYTDSEGNQYWSFIAYGIGLRDFGKTFSVTGSALNSLKEDRDSIVELAQIAKGSWTGEWLAYAEAVENFHKVYIQDSTWTALEPAVPEKTEVSAVKGEAEYISATAGLAMGDAVAVNFELTLETAPTNFTVKVNGNPIENAATIVTGEGETTVTVDLYFHAKHMEADFEIVLSSDAGTYFTYKGSVAAMAYKLANAVTDGTTITETTKANANALLYYIEKTVACANL